MSYALSNALQEAVFGALLANPALEALVDGAIYDALPTGHVPRLYVSLGPETARERNDASGRGAEHRFVVSVVTELPGFAQAKAVAGTVCDILEDAPLTLSRGRLVGLTFVKAAAAKIDNATGRKIDLTFRARVEDS